MSPRVLRRSFSTAAAALMLAFSAAGCASKDEPPVITPKPEPSAGSPASDAGDDGSVASDGGGGAAAKPTDAAIDKSQLPPENRDLKAPDPKDYPGFYEKTDEGAGAVLLYFVDAMHYYESTGDDSPLADVYDAEQCTGCRQVTKHVAEAIVDGTYSAPTEAQIQEHYVKHNKDRVLAYVEYGVPSRKFLSGAKPGRIGLR